MRSNAWMDKCINILPFFKMIKNKVVRIGKLLPLFIDKNLIPFIPVLEWIAETPTSSEYFEDLNEIAQEFLKIKLREDKSIISVIEDEFPVAERKDRNKFMKMTSEIQEITDRVNKNMPHLKCDYTTYVRESDPLTVSERRTQGELRLR